jgi:hypothetical protein
VDGRPEPVLGRAFGPTRGPTMTVSWRPMGHSQDPLVSVDAPLRLFQLHWMQRGGAAANVIAPPKVSVRKVSWSFVSVAL